MAAKMRKQHFGIFVLQKLLIITVTNYAADCFIERSLMLWIAEAIDKNEICVSVNGRAFLREIKHCTTCLYSSSSRYIWNLSFFIGLPPLFLLCLSPFKKPLPDKRYIFIFIRGYENMYAAKRFFDFLGEVGFAAS